MRRRSGERQPPCSWTLHLPRIALDSRHRACRPFRSTGFVLLERWPTIAAKVSFVDCSNARGDLDIGCGPLGYHRGMVRAYGRKDGPEQPINAGHLGAPNVHSAGWRGMLAVAPAQEQPTARSRTRRGITGAKHVDHGSIFFVAPLRSELAGSSPIHIGDDADAVGCGGRTLLAVA